MFKCYRCEVCGQIYNKEDDCIMCERSHPRIEFPANATYLPMCRYPATIRIAFHDGTSRVYCLMPQQQQSAPMAAANADWQTGICNGMAPEYRGMMPSCQDAAIMDAKRG